MVGENRNTLLPLGSTCIGTFVHSVPYHRDKYIDREGTKSWDLTRDKEDTEIRNWSWLENGTWEVTESVADSRDRSVTAREETDIVVVGLIRK